MNKKAMYTKVSERHEPTTHKIKNCCCAFISGGTLAVLAQLVFVMFNENLGMPKDESVSAVVILVIAITALFTGLGVYDKAAKICGAGLFIPISGFANALTSCALESKNEGLIFGIGSNMFKLAGSVITYGIVSAYILGFVRYFIGV